jgi:dolichol-phosphate mannosyltransferase
MLHFVVPAYNEEQNIGSLLESLSRRLAAQDSPYRIVVVDDGSVDRTVAIVRDYAAKMPIQLVPHETNKGPGKAFDTGFRAVLHDAADGDLIITQEADNTSDPAILGPMIREAQQDAEVVLASCYAPGGGIEGTTFTRKFLSSGANLMLRIVFPIGIHTYSSFYRVYRVAVLRKAYALYGDNLITEPGFVSMVELLIKLGRMGVRFKEVPMVLRCQARRDQSKMKVFKTIRGYLRLMARLRLPGSLPKPPLAASPR